MPGIVPCGGTYRDREGPVLALRELAFPSRPKMVTIWCAQCSVRGVSMGQRRHGAGSCSSRGGQGDGEMEERRRLVTFMRSVVFSQGVSQVRQQERASQVEGIASARASRHECIRSAQWVSLEREGIKEFGFNPQISGPSLLGFQPGRDVIGPPHRVPNGVWRWRAGQKAVSVAHLRNDAV